MIFALAKARWATIIIINNNNNNDNNNNLVSIGFAINGRQTNNVFGLYVQHICKLNW